MQKTIPAEKLESLQKHETTLALLLTAVQKREYFSLHHEIPSERFYGEGMKKAALEEFRALQNTEFMLPSLEEALGDGLKFEFLKNSAEPAGLPKLGILYPYQDPKGLVEQAKRAMESWLKLAVKQRACIALEILTRLNKKSFLMALSVEYTTGQPYIMAFQAGGAHATERGAEALAYAYAALMELPKGEILWGKPRGRDKPALRLKKRFIACPLGVGVIIGCATFPTWNSYPAIFANLVLGAASLIKPHPEVILPLALTVQIAQQVLVEYGQDPKLLNLLLFKEQEELQGFLKQEKISLVDFTGSKTFGSWLEKELVHARVFTEKSGVNAAIIDSYKDLKAVAANLALSLSLYSGQMCTAPQNIFIQQSVFEEMLEALKEALQKLLADDKRAVALLGRLRSPASQRALEEALKLGKLRLPSKKIKHPVFPDASLHTPLLIEITAIADAEENLTENLRTVLEKEFFGPAVFLIKTKNSEHSFSLAEASLKAAGALTLALYTENKEVKEQGIALARRQHVNLSLNLSEEALVNHSASFSDFHGTGGNAAGNCALTTPAFVHQRFSVLTVKEQA